MSAGLRTPRRDQGGATVAACVAVAALLVLTLAIGQVGAVVVARHRAQAAADLGALAAAGGLAAGTGSGCERAEDVARRMRATVLECDVAGWDVTLVVEMGVAVGPFGTRVARAAARAGPVDS
ncbi:flp pilus-assembly TadE/G-like family protein [Nocardia sp. CDC159]|uniref:Flp pilus-assembly TadE/G-like family protein n=1 Tax=Nocardia pulmonis TaxID=2951408 RepID=A0A9X2IUD1_9NOCA|nr:MULTISPECIES: Rv3654c family TadE-like protein [Nocardia]MCM6772747.1 flp pilus-assembly TadE/G-like family protein [Nocardia pulmonis]MCM6785950.1 flp pilus-assembly TadE/G-like family protein [Nocardia sp. CDC159]